MFEMYLSRVRFGNSKNVAAQIGFMNTVLRTLREACKVDSTQYTSFRMVRPTFTRKVANYPSARTGFSLHCAFVCCGSAGLAET